MTRNLFFGVLLSVCFTATASADPAPDPTTIDVLSVTMTSHDGSWFGTLYDTGLGYEDPVVTSSDGAIQAGTFRRLTDDDLDAIAPSLVLWKPTEPLAAGEYAVAFESQTGTLQVDPELDLELAFGDAMVGTEYLNTRNGEAVGGTSCCTVEGCGGDSCVDCWPRYNFLSATTTLSIPAFPNSIALRVERGSDGAIVRVQGPEVTAFTGFDESEVCIGVDVADSSFTILQSEERCGAIEEPSEELVRETETPDTCVSDPCIRIASQIDDAPEDCPDDLGTQPTPEPGPGGTDNGGSKSEPGCGCASTEADPTGVAVAVLGLLLGVRRRR